MRCEKGLYSRAALDVFSDRLYEIFPHFFVHIHHEGVLKPLGHRNQWSLLRLVFQSNKMGQLKARSAADSPTTVSSAPLLFIKKPSIRSESYTAKSTNEVQLYFSLSPV